MHLQKFVIRDLGTARLELHHVDDIQRQPRHLCEAPGKRRFAAAGIAKDRDSLHATHSVSTRSAAPGMRLQAFRSPGFAAPGEIELSQFWRIDIVKEFVVCAEAR